MKHSLIFQCLHYNLVIHSSKAHLLCGKSKRVNYIYGYTRSTLAFTILHHCTGVQLNFINFKHGHQKLGGATCPIVHSCVDSVTLKNKIELYILPSTLSNWAQMLEARSSHQWKCHGPNPRKEVEANTYKRGSSGMKKFRSLLPPRTTVQTTAVRHQNSCWTLSSDH